jgi:hypothetical protein
MPARLTVNIGDRFGRLIIAKELKLGANRKRRFRFLCDCGNTTDMLLQCVTGGRTISCGCYCREAAAIRNTTHGLSKSGLSNVHRNMLVRCYDERSDSYPNYGARGIRVCTAWRNTKTGLASFVSWNQSLPTNMRRKQGMLLDRIDNARGYSPENCRWVSAKTSNRNKRDNVLCVYKGKKQLLVDLYDEDHHPSLSYRCALARFAKLGWSAKAAVSIPVRRKSGCNQ